MTKEELQQEIDQIFGTRGMSDDDRKEAIMQLLSRHTATVLKDLDERGLAGIGVAQATKISKQAGGNVDKAIMDTATVVNADWRRVLTDIRLMHLKREEEKL